MFTVRHKENKSCELLGESKNTEKAESTLEAQKAKSKSSKSSDKDL